MKKWGLVLCYAFVGLSLCSAAWSVTTGGATISFSYDGSVNMNVSKTLTVNRGTTSGGKVYFYILISGAGVGSFAPGERRVFNSSNIANASFQVFLQRSSTVPDTEVGSINQVGTFVTSGSIASGASSGTAPYYYHIRKAEGVVPAATYANTFSYTVYTTGSTNPVSSNILTTTSPTAMCSGTQTVNVVSTTPAANFSFTLLPTTLNFNNLQPTSTVSTSVDMQIKAPANFAISAYSSNQGLLKQGGTTDTLPYHLVYNSNTISLANGVVRIFSDAVGTGGIVKTYTLTVALDEIGIKDPVTYTDNLYLNFTTQ
jgi:hypothetical protein